MNVLVRRLPPLTLSLLLSICGPVATTDVATAVPPGEYCFVLRDYNAQCLQLSEGGSFTSVKRPLTPTSQVRPFCGECPNSYNMLTVNSGTSPYFVIPDEGSLNVLRKGQWSQWHIGNCDPFLLQSIGTIVYVLCRIGSRDHQVTAYTVDLAASTSVEPRQITINSTKESSTINPDVAAFFVVNDFMHLCVAMDNSTLLFYDFHSVLVYEGESSCNFIGQLTTFQENENGQTYILVECTEGSGSLAVTQSQVYNFRTAKCVDTSILGSHILGKNSMSPDGDVIVSWKDATCVFSLLEINSPVTHSFTLNTGSIRSATFMTLQESLVFVVDVFGPNGGLHWFNISLALADGEVAVPQFVSGSASVCVAQQCFGIAPIGSNFVLAAVEDGTKVQFYSLFGGSHFGPIDVDKVATRIVVSFEEKPTPPPDVFPPRGRHLVIGLPLGILSPCAVAVAVAVVVIVCCWICCKPSCCKHARGEYSAEETGRPMVEARANGDVQDQPSSNVQETVMVTGKFTHCNSGNVSTTNGSRLGPEGEDSQSN